MNHPQELPFLRLAGGTMTGALNMGAQNITNCGDITADNASGYKLRNQAASSSAAAFFPDRSDTNTGICGASSGIDFVANNSRRFTLDSSGRLTTVNGSFLDRVGISNDTGNFIVSDDMTVNGADADRGGATCTFMLNAMAETLAAAGTHTFTSAIPAGATVVGVTTRVTTTITGCTSIQIGDGTDADRFGNAIALTAGTTTTNANWTITSTPIYAAATNIVITAVGGGASFTAGAMRVCVYYLAPTAPSS